MAQQLSVSAIDLNNSTRHPPLITVRSYKRILSCEV